MIRKTLLAVATSLGVAIGSFGAATAPVAAAITMVPAASVTSAGAPVIQIKHRHWHKKKKHRVCHTVWVGKKIWRHHHWIWIKIPITRCHWVWGWW